MEKHAPNDLKDQEENPRSIVQKLYDENIKITDLQLAEAIVSHDNLTPLDLWLLPQYPFDVWRRKHDYPRLLENIKGRQSDFTTWMSDQGISDEYLLGGYLSEFFQNKPKSVDKTLYLIRVSYKGEINLQCWHKYDGIKESQGDGELVHYEFIKTFISYYDWKLLKGEEFNFTHTFFRNSPNTPHEEVYLNHNIPLLKMGGITPPTNVIGMLLRGKRLEFVIVSGLELNGTLYFGQMGNLEFVHCTVDNLKCGELEMPPLHFENCSVRNIQIRNSNIQSWMFITSRVTGNIIDSKISSMRIYGGQFTPTFVNSEVTNVGVEHVGIPHDVEFEKTYRGIAKSARDAGNKALSKEMKIAELDFIKDKQKGLRKLVMAADKVYWEYGQEPGRLILITLGSVLLFGVFFSIFPENFKGLNLASQPYWKVLFNSIYYSVVTFTTLGYGDISPTGFLKFFAAIEAIFGAITLGFLVAGLSKENY